MFISFCPPLPLGRLYWLKSGENPCLCTGLDFSNQRVSLCVIVCLCMGVCVGVCMWMGVGVCVCVCVWVCMCMFVGCRIYMREGGWMFWILWKIVKFLSTALLIKNKKWTSLPKIQFTASLSKYGYNLRFMTHAYLLWFLRVVTKRRGS